MIIRKIYKALILQTKKNFKIMNKATSIIKINRQKNYMMIKFRLKNNKLTHKKN